MNFIRNLIRLLRRIFLFRDDRHVSVGTIKHYATLESKTGWEGPTYVGKFNR